MIPKVVVITGPTASGKTALGVELALKTDGEVVSADSMQVYKYMDVGTAKPEKAEMKGVCHHMIDTVSPFEAYSVARYVNEASSCVDDILRRGKLPIIVGGTGLYIDSLISGRDFAEKSDPELRERLTAKANALGGEKMLEELSKFDPQTAEKLHSNDIKRIVRAFEVYELTGKTIYQHDLETKSTPPRYDAVKIALTFGDRQDLYDRINARVDIMMEKGLEKEVRDLLDMGLTSEHTAMQAIGYKEMTDAVLGKCTVSEAVETIKMESRRYAKRQLSWLRRDDAINWIIWEKKPNISIGLQNSTNFLHQYK